MPIRSLAPWGGRRRIPSTDVFNQFEEFINEFDRAFALPRISVGARAGSDFTPALDFEDRDNSYMITVDLPGLKKEDIKLDLSDNVLTISGERMREVQAEGGYNERPFGKFERSFSMPTQVDADKIEAQFSNGVLYITLPKSEEARSHSIKIM